MNHRSHGLRAVARATPVLSDAVSALSGHRGVDGVLVLSTCNRIDAYVELADESAGSGASPGSAGHLLDPVVHALDGVDIVPEVLDGPQALAHLFATASGLESMVVGEREIAGQLRRAALVSQQAGMLSGRLRRAIDHASAVSRRVERLTGLGGLGRSVVAVGLDLVAGGLPPSSQWTVVLFGTGSYAGATVADLRRRGVLQVHVHSASGRSERFARAHGAVALPDRDVVDALADADLAVTCRGLGVPVLTEDVVRAALERRAGRAVARAPLAILDLSLEADTGPDLGELDGVRRVGLDHVQSHVPPAGQGALRDAQEIVAAEVREFEAQERARSLDTAIVALRAHVDRVVEEEVGRLRGSDDVITVDQAEQAVRRAAARLLHEPQHRAHAAAREGRTGDYLAALDLVTGIRPPDGRR